MYRSLAWFAMSLLVAPLGAQDGPTAAQVTESGRTIGRALDVVLAGRDVTEGEPRTLVLLIDATPSLRLRQHNEAGGAAGFSPRVNQIQRARHLVSPKTFGSAPTRCQLLGPVTL